MIRILIISPDHGERVQLRGDVAPLDAEVHLAGSCGEASRLMQETKIDVAIFDAQVVEQEGIHPLLHLRDANPDLQGVALVSEHAPTTLLADIQASRFDYLRKPAHPPDLVHRVKEALDRLWLEGHNRQLAALLDQRVQDLKKLYEMAQKIGTSPDSRSLTTAMTATIQEILRAEGASLMLWDPELRKIRIDVATGPGATTVKSMTLAPGEGIVGWVIEHDEPVLVEDVSKDLRFSPRFDKATKLTTRSIVCAPLRSKGTVIGAIEAVNQVDGIPFGEADLSLLVAVASHASLALENAQLFASLKEEREKLEQNSQEIGNLYALNRHLNAVVEYQELVRYLVEEGAKVIGGCEIATLLVQEEDKFFLYLPSSGQLHSKCERQLVEHSISQWNKLCPSLLAENEITIRHIEGRGQRPRAAHKLHPVSSIPLVAKKRVVGLLTLVDNQKKEIDVATMKLLIMAGNHAAISIENALLYEQTGRLSKIDGLTGVYNRRSFEEQLAVYFERARRFNERLSLMILDVDHFKRVNDTYGHQTGDRVLKQLALIVVGEVRSIDPVFRYGGEEFAVLLPETDRAGAIVVAERARKKVGTANLGGELPLSATVSIGISSYPDTRITKPAELVSLADKALYGAKFGGRNRVRNG